MSKVLMILGAVLLVVGIYMSTIPAIGLWACAVTFPAGLIIGTGFAMWREDSR